MRYTGSSNGAAPTGVAMDRVTYFKLKMCSRYVLLEICCASMVRYKVCRLLEHRLVGLLQATKVQPHSCLLSYENASVSYIFLAVLS